MTAILIGVSGIVLAGGRSSRFGTSKLDADLGGMTVLDRTIERLQPLVDEVLVIGRTGARPGVRFIEDPRPFEGPLVGLAAGLDAAASDMILVVGGDMPLVQPGVLRLLAERLRMGSDSAATLDDREGSRPLPMALRRAPARAAGAAAIEAGERSLRALLARLPASAVPEGQWQALDPEGDSLLDIDTPADLDRARGRMPG
jgi:molybdopterin-guanine dinucleotide biosynthesis protein A